MSARCSSGFFACGAVQAFPASGTHDLEVDALRISEIDLDDDAGKDEYHIDSDSDDGAFQRSIPQMRVRASAGKVGVEDALAVSGAPPESDWPEELVSSATQYSFQSSTESSVWVRQISEEYFAMQSITIRSFLAFNAMETYESLVVSGTVGPVLPSAIVHFISHQWLSFKHPDPHCIQLSKMQGVFQDILDGKCAELFADLDWKGFAERVRSMTCASYRQTEATASAVGRTSTSSILTQDLFCSHVDTGHVWLDYSCIPQAAEARLEQLDAIRSIPAYLERCDYFWVLAPEAKHDDTKEWCNFGTWRSRGWCRLEEWGNYLSVKSCAPVVITNTPKLRTILWIDFLMACSGKPSMAPCAGDFSCCRNGHRVVDASGQDGSIVCDRTVILPVLTRLYEAKRQHFLELPSSMSYRFFIGFVEPVFFGGAGEANQYNLANPRESVRAFMRRCGFESLSDLGQPSIGLWNLAAGHGNIPMLKKLMDIPEAMLQLQDPVYSLSVLHWAACSGHAQAMKFLFDNSLCSLGIVNEPRGDLKITALDRAAKYGHPNTVQSLVSLKANVHSCRADGSTALHGAAESGHLLCCEALLIGRADANALDAKGRSPLHMAADPVTFYGCCSEKPSVLALLLSARADPHQSDFDGRSAYTIAVATQFHAGMKILVGLARSTQDGNALAPPLLLFSRVRASLKYEFRIRPL